MTSHRGRFRIHWAPISSLLNIWPLGGRLWAFLTIVKCFIRALRDASDSRGRSSSSHRAQSGSHTLMVFIQFPHKATKNIRRRVRRSIHNRMTVEKKDTQWETERRKYIWSVKGNYLKARDSFEWCLSPNYKKEWFDIWGNNLLSCRALDGVDGYHSCLYINH